MTIAAPTVAAVTDGIIIYNVWMHTLELSMANFSMHQQRVLRKTRFVMILLDQFAAIPCVGNVRVYLM